MTPETAIGLLKHHINAWEGKFPSSHFEACEMGIEALEKEIPQKVLQESSWHMDYCPNCGHGAYENFNRCPTCGQKIDWE